MMNHISLQNYFPGARTMEGDSYVADYTNDDSDKSKLKVQIYSEPFDDIAYFHLHKDPRLNLKYLAINFEDYPGFIKGIKNCECAFHPITDAKRPWMLFLELKYCSDQNIDDYVSGAYAQMNTTFEKLVDLNIISKESTRIYFNYSVPDHSELAPFGEFALSQYDTLKALEESGIHLLGQNKLLVMHPSYIKEAKLRVN